MFREEIDMAGNAAKKKIQFLRQQTGAYFISAMLAGMFVGFGVLLAFTVYYGRLLWRCPQSGFDGRSRALYRK